MKTQLLNNTHFPFYFVFVLLNGLYVATTLKYIKRNCRTHNLPKLETDMKIYSTQETSIIEIRCSRHLRLQYLLRKELNIDELQMISETVLPSEGKKLIINAYAHMMNNNPYFFTTEFTDQLAFKCGYKRG